MKNASFSVKSIILGVLLGTAATALFYVLWTPSGTQSSMTSTKPKPQYWVAPMDANYTSDKPGKSPMGMDLIPVYEDGTSGSDSGPGTIKISPEVVNNLGVRTAKAQNRPLNLQISTVGYVQYDEDQIVNIHPRVEGWVETLYVKAVGDPVVKGQAMYALYSPQLVNAQEEFLLALERKNTRMIQGARDRLTSLKFPAEGIKRLNREKKVVQTVTFYAPQSGVIDNLNIREGSFVKPGTTMLSIGKLDQVWVEAEVFERQAADVAVGIPVTMSLAYMPGKKWRGKVDYVYPTVNAKTRTIKVRLRFDNKSEVLKPNMFAQVNIHVPSTQDSLLIPKEAVIRLGNSQRVVLALGEGRYKSINVEVGRYDVDSAEILSGLTPGDEVVSSAQFLLDSESSKSSDFKRMYHPPETGTATSSVWVQATINAVMSDHRMLKVSHQAIEQWDWPAMDMDFMVAKSVDLGSLKKGMKRQIEIEKNAQGKYEVTDVRSSPPELTSQLSAENFASVEGVINAVMPGNRMVNISRAAIQKWDRPAATVDFTVSDNIDLSSLSTNMRVQFTFHVTDGSFVITEIRPLSTQKMNKGVNND